MTFLTARWRHLAMVNWAIDPAVLRPHVPRETELDQFRGVTYVSLVGFLFLDARVLGVPVPFHRNFEEVNLRFYVRRECADGVRRAVTFVREIVPRRAIAATARLVYNEPYIQAPMSHHIEPHRDAPEATTVQYRWRHAGMRYAMAARATAPYASISDGSVEEFIAEHYWGYTAQRDGGTVEYQVEHPRWRIAPAACTLEGDMGVLYGNDFAATLAQPPVSTFIAAGSEARVMKPRRIA